MSCNLIALKNLNVAFGSKGILQEVSLAIHEGESVAFIGLCGSGKTTLLKLLCGFLSAEKGWRITGENVFFPGLRIACIQQNPSIQVFKNFVHEEFPNLCKDEVARLLQENDCEYLLKKRCLELSQGEKTIVAILRAFSQNVNLLALDEVSVNLSVTRRKWLAEKINAFKVNGGTVIIVDHDLSIVSLVDKIFLLQKKQIISISHERAEQFLTRESAVADCIISSFAKNTNDAILELNDIVDPCIACSQSKPLSFSLRSGEIVGVSGDNGSGKSTLIDIICGIKKPTHGAIFWQQNGPQKKLKSMRDRKSLITLITQESSQQFFTNNVQDELNLIKGNMEQALAQQLITLFSLPELFARSIDSLSYGEKQRLAIAYSMLANSSVLLFDEPTYGMDNLTYVMFVAACRFLTQQQKILLIASHEKQLLEKLANYVIYL